MPKRGLKAKIETPKLAVGYYRVSTRKQKSGHSIEAQREAVQDFAVRNNMKLIHEVEDCASGGSNDREKLRQALDYAAKHEATLVTHKLDRLSRSLVFIATLLEADVPFMCIEMPGASRETLQIYAVFAEMELRKIKGRIRDGLKQTKKKLGAARPGFWEDPKRAATLRGHLAQNRPLAAKARKEKADKQWDDAYDLVIELHDKDTSLQNIGEALLAHGHKPARSKTWSRASVRLLIQRARRIRKQPKKPKQEAKDEVF